MPALVNHSAIVLLMKHLPYLHQTSLQNRRPWGINPLSNSTVNTILHQVLENKYANFKKKIDEIFSDSVRLADTADIQET